MTVLKGISHFTLLVTSEDQVEGLCSWLIENCTRWRLNQCGTSIGKIAQVLQRISDKINSGIEGKYVYISDEN